MPVLSRHRHDHACPFQAFPGTIMPVLSALRLPIEKNPQTMMKKQEKGKGQA
jgi:hypothetical protein